MRRTKQSLIRGYTRRQKLDHLLVEGGTKCDDLDRNTNNDQGMLVDWLGEATQSNTTAGGTNSVGL